MRAYLSHLLAAYWTVEAVADGLTALAVAQARVPDLVLADVMMPGLDGFALLRELRADPRTKTIPIILLSARAGEEAKVEGLAAGADDYLIKPFSARELLARVRVHLEMVRIRREAARRTQELLVEAELVRERLEGILAGINDYFVMYDREWRYVYVNDKAAQTLGFPKEQLIGQCIWDLFPEAVDNLFYQKLHQASAEGREIVFEHYYQPWDRWFENHVYPISDGVLLFGTDITERKQAEEAERRARQMAEETASRITALQTITAAFSEALTPKQVCRVVVEQSLAILGANAGTVVLLDRTGAHLEMVSDLGYSTEVIERWGRFPLTSPTPLAVAVRTGQPIFIESPEAEMTNYPELIKAQATHYPAFAAIPLMIETRILGGLSLSFEEPQVFREEDRGFALALARQCAQALERARLYQEAQTALEAVRYLNLQLEERVAERTAQLQALNQKLEAEIIEHRQTQTELAELQRRLAEGREAERLYLAQELHDGPVQELYGVIYTLSGLAQTVEGEASQAQFLSARELTQQVIGELRTMMNELRPPTLAPFGLEKAISSHIDQFRQDHPELTVRIELTPDGTLLPEPTRLALFRIYQAALNNIVRHAEARQVYIRFRLNVERITLEIEDDGRGFKLPERWIDLARQGHLGLVGVVERAEAIGGQLQVISAPGAGTLIRVVVPASSISPVSFTPDND